MQRHDGNGFTFDGTISDCDACAVRKGQQLALPKKAQHAGITRPFQLCYGDLMGLIHPRGLRGFQIRQQDHRPVHQVDRRLLAGEQELRIRLLSPVRHIRCHTLRRPSHSLACRQRRGIHELSVQAVFAWKRASPRSLRPPARLSKMACPSALAGPFAVWLAAFSSTVDSRSSCGGSSC